MSYVLVRLFHPTLIFNELELQLHELMQSVGDYRKKEIAPRNRARIQSVVSRPGTTGEKLQEV